MLQHFWKWGEIQFEARIFTPSHTPQEKYIVFCYLSDFLSRKNRANEDAVEKSETLVNDGGGFISIVTWIGKNGNFPLKGFVVELAR